MAQLKLSNFLKMGEQCQFFKVIFKKIAILLAKAGFDDILFDECLLYNN